MSSFNWLDGVESPIGPEDRKIAEVRFKNGRKDFFTYPGDMLIQEDEIVAVEASPGHDLGIISLTGDIVKLQMERKKFDPEKREMRKIFRHARVTDLEKWFEALLLEDATLHKTRVVVMDLQLNMKINDVEYQGDKTKAIFYYTADERVDFRELIKRLAETFRIRIEIRRS